MHVHHRDTGAGGKSGGEMQPAQGEPADPGGIVRALGGDRQSHLCVFVHYFGRSIILLRIATPLFRTRSRHARAISRFTACFRSLPASASSRFWTASPAMRERVATLALAI